MEKFIIGDTVRFIGTDTLLTVRQSTNRPTNTKSSEATMMPAVNGRLGVYLELVKPCQLTKSRRLTLPWHERP